MKCQCPCHNVGTSLEEGQVTGQGKDETTERAATDAASLWRGCSYGRGCQADGDCAQEDGTLLTEAGDALNESDAAFEE